MIRNRTTPILRLGRWRFTRLIIGLMLQFLPTWLVRPFANIFGHAIAPGARVGFSLLICDRIVMAPDTRVGHFNYVNVRRLFMRNKSRLGHMNSCRGPVSLRLDENAVIGNRNTITRAPLGTTSGPAQLWLGRLAKITADHSLDCTLTIRLGHYCTLAGKGSQIWTHGYVHEQEAPNRYRVDGSVLIGNNVYLGAGVIVTGGVTICDGASVGVGTCVTKNLLEPGFYISGALRMLPKPADPESRIDMERVDDPSLVERVYRKYDARF